MPRVHDAVRAETRLLVDGNEAVARVAYALSEVIAIYPITPATPMGEWADARAAARRPNLFGQVPSIVEMQSEAGAAGTLHGALSAGALSSTFTSSQGLLLMIPVMYKVAGELSPLVIHVAARTVATHALSIFGDHSDVMAARSTGFAMLASGSVQEAADLAFVAHDAAIRSRIPFLHFFDGFRTSHEIRKIGVLSETEMRALLDGDAIEAFRSRRMTPDRPTVRGTSQNPDVFFQSREAANPYYLECPRIVERSMGLLAAATGRRYRLFDYAGAPDAERVVVMMGSGAETAAEAVDALRSRGEKVGVLKVRLYRPFDAGRFLAALPASVRKIAVLDRTKEPGSAGEPLFLDVVAAFEEDAARARWPSRPRVVGGRYGLSSKEFTPAMAKAVFDDLAGEPRRRFTVGIRDDVGGTSLSWDPSFTTEAPEVRRAVFYGLGSDGTIGASKQSIKIIAERAGVDAQAYFVYDSKKSGSMTGSHLRYGRGPIRSSYLIDRADFVACHHESLLRRGDLLALAAPGATFLLNASSADGVWARLPRRAQQSIREKRLKVYAIDAGTLAGELGLGRRINTIMQACFFELARPVPEYKGALLAAARVAYRDKGEAVVRANEAAIERAAARLRPVEPGELSPEPAPLRNGYRAEFLMNVTRPLIEGRGEQLPVSALPADGVFPCGTARFERRGLADRIPVWDESLCIQCNKCVLVCPHAAIRAKAYPGDALASAPESFKSMAWKGREFPAGARYTIQTAPEDCTGCRLCVEICPGKDKADAQRRALRMEPTQPLRQAEARNFEFFLRLPESARGAVALGTPKGSQLIQPLFEFSGACPGCGETPYVKLLSQLFGDRLLVANATGCSSIYGGNLPTTPWTADQDGRGPAWSNSLFEDNAEFGLGFRLALDAQRERALHLIDRLGPRLDPELAEALSRPQGQGDAALVLRRVQILELKESLRHRTEPEARELLEAADALADKTVWIVGGDGWAYDIGFGGLDHVLRSGRKVNVLVLDTEVYSNTGGQASKATPRAAVAKFAPSGKRSARKDLAAMAMDYRDVYVARVALGANDTQTVQAFMEAEAYPGPSLIIAYSPCIAQGIDLSRAIERQRAAVGSGYWPLLRFDPSLIAQGRPPLRLDSKPASVPFEDYAYAERRYRGLREKDPGEAARLMELAKRDIEDTWKDLRRRLAEPAPPEAR